LRLLSERRSAESLRTTLVFRSLDREREKDSTNHAHLYNVNIALSIDLEIPLVSGCSGRKVGKPAIGDAPPADLLAHSPHQPLASI